jgi:hypothetical protein
MNLSMYGMNETVDELFDMMKVAEKDTQKNTNHVMMVKKSTHFKKKKFRGKKTKAEAHRTPNKGKAPKAGPTPYAKCFFCKEKDH